MQMRINYQELSFREEEHKKGEISRVYFGTWQGRPVAIKKFLLHEYILDKDGKKGAVKDYLDGFFHNVRERSSIVLPYFGYALHENGKSDPPHAYFYLVMECPVGGFTPLSDILSQQLMKESPCSAYRLQLALSVAELVREAHIGKQVLLGQSLRPENLFIHTSGECRLSDCFELRYAIYAINNVLDHHIGRELGWLDKPRDITNRSLHIYPAPEALSVIYKPMLSGDIYALGILVWQILTGKSPFQGMETPKIRALKRSSSLSEALPLDNIPLELKEMLESCFEKDSGKRMNAFRVASILSSYMYGDIHENFLKNTGFSRDIGQIVKSYLTGVDGPKKPSLFPPQKVDPMEIQRMHAEITTAGKIAEVNEEKKQLAL